MSFLNWKHLYEKFDRLFYFCKELDKGNSKEKHNEKTNTECGFDEANLISSLCENGTHKPVLDFDFPCELIPSSTPGNYHLYINKEISWESYQKILLAMQEAGLLQVGFVKNSIEKGATFVRPPWIKKPNKVELIDRSKCLLWCGMTYKVIGVNIADPLRTATQKILIKSWLYNSGFPEVETYPFASKNTVTWCSQNCKINKYPPKEDF